MHWVKPTYQDQGHTVFGELGTRRESRIDSDLMSEIFAVTTEENERKGFDPKKLAACAGIKVLDSTRAQNLGILLSRLRMPTLQACQAINETRFQEHTLGVQDLDIIASSMPTVDEVTKLEAHVQAPEKLRDVEQKVLPLCSVSRVRLRVMKIAVSHGSQSSLLHQRVQVLHKAATGVRRSQQLRELLNVTLQIGNFVNHGITDKDPDKGAVKGFALESLHTLSMFKRGETSALHFLCLTLMLTFGNSFLDSLLQSLDSVNDAKREHLSTLETDVKKFQGEVEFATQFFEKLSEEDPEKERLMKLSVQLSHEGTKLKTELDSATQVCRETVSYFSVSSEDSKRPFQDVCADICKFLHQFKAAWKQIETGQGRLGKLLTCTPTSSPKNTSNNAHPIPKPPERNVDPASTTVLDNVPIDASRLKIHLNSTCSSSCSLQASQSSGYEDLKRSPHGENPKLRQLWQSMQRQLSEPLTSNCPMVMTMQRQLTDPHASCLSEMELVTPGKRSLESYKICEFHVLHSSSDHEAETVSVDLSESDSEASATMMYADQRYDNLIRKVGPSDRQQSLDTTCGASDVSDNSCGTAA